MSGYTLDDSSADARPGQTPATEDWRGWGGAPFGCFSPFDKSRATGHRAEDVTAGNGEE